MTTELMKQRGIRTTNLKIDLHKELRIMQVEKDYDDMSSLIRALLNFYKKKNKKSMRDHGK